MRLCGYPRVPSTETDWQSLVLVPVALHRSGQLSNEVSRFSEDVLILASTCGSTGWNEEESLGGVSSLLDDQVSPLLEGRDP